MSKNKLLSKIISVVTAAVMTFGVCSYTVAAANNTSGSTSASKSSDDSAPEEDIGEDGFEENDLLAIAGASNDEPEVTIPARRIRIKSGSSKILGLGQTFKIVPTLVPSKSDDVITYKSMKRSIAQVDEDGNVTAVGIGETTIRLTTTSGVKASVRIIVSDAIVVTPSEDTTDTGSTTAEADDEDEDVEIISDEDVTEEEETATEQEEEKEKEKEEETSTEQEEEKKEEETSTEQEKEEEKETVPAVKSIDILDSNIMVRKGKKVTLEYVLYPLGSSDTVKFSSSNKSVATVSSKGVVKGISAGTAKITIKTSSGVKATCSVTVYSGVYKGIDVSKWQGTISWKKVSAAGIDFAMIRSSYGSSNVDERLKTNVAGCEKYNIPYGFYHYCYAKTVAEAKKEARFFLKTIKKYNPEYPIVLDIEESFYKDMSKKQVTDIICAFMEELEGAGYYAMIYSYAKFFADNTNISRLTKYDIWVACWGDKDKLNSNYDYHYGMWQYSSTGSVSGISGDVDLDYAYKDYASRIRKNGLNNLT